MVGSVTEHALIAQHSGGDPQAFGQLVALYRAPIFSFIIRSGVNRAEGEDLLQEIFLRIHRGAPNYKPDRPLKSWIFTIAANCIKSHWRKLGRDASTPMTTAIDTTSASDDASSEQIAIAKESAQWLGQAVDALPLSQREIIVLSCIENLDHKSIADILNIPVATVKTNLRRARLSLAKSLQKRRIKAEGEVER